VVASRINPSVVRVTTEKKVRKALQITVPVKERFRWARLRKIRVEPSTVAVEGLNMHCHQLDSVATEEIDLPA
jgi:YbbR domain-containing protein